MIAYLIGNLADVETDSIVIETGNIGYNIKVPSNVIGKLPAIGEQIKVHTYTSVREDAINLFGFLTKDDLNMYRMLITVNGVGPKAGLAILSVMDADAIRLAVLSQDAKAIAKAPGIGAKTAQRIILDLKDKISMEDTLLSQEADIQKAAVSSGFSQVHTEAVEALTALGYSPSDALRAVKAVEQENMNVEDLLKAALKKMF